MSESNLINRVVFEGNSKVKTDTLTSEVRTRAHGSFNQTVVEQDIARLLEIYKRSGRAAAKVTYRTVELPNGRIDVVFTVEEGDKTGVKEIKFVGNNVYSTGRLVELMETTEMNFLSFLKTSDVYDPDRIASDLELVRRFYLKNGYADFHVISSDAVFDPAQGGYIVTIVVEEGPQYRVSAVDIESHLPDIDPPRCDGDLRIAAGDIYNGDAVEKTVEAMTREIARQGYAFSQVRPRGERNPAAQTVAIGFVVDEGPRVYIERINIRGNTRTRDYVIRREFEIGEGDAYNRVLIDRAERRLNGLGFFKKVRVTNEPGSSLRPRRHQRRCRGAGDRQFRRLGRLFDDAKASSAKSRCRRATSWAAARRCAPRVAGRPACARRRASASPSPISSTSASRPASTSSPRSRTPLTIPTTTRPRSAARCASAFRSPTRSRISPRYSIYITRHLDPERQQPSLQRLSESDPGLHAGLWLYLCAERRPTSASTTTV